MKFVIGLLLCLAPIISSAGDISSQEYRLVTFEPNLKKALQDDPKWKLCGKYFAEQKATGGRIVHFAFEKGSFSGPSTSFIFTMNDQITVSIDKEATTPMVIVQERGRRVKFTLVMNAADYKVGLPCLARGVIGT